MLEMMYSTRSIKRKRQNENRIQSFFKIFSWNVENFENSQNFPKSHFFLKNSLMIYYIKCQYIYFDILYSKSLKNF